MHHDMRILLLTHSFNSLTQRLFVELEARGHEVTIEFDIKDSVTIEAVRAAKPDLVIAPFLKRAIPPEVYDAHTCLVVHPGPPGDRGPSALDWAILNGESEWGVTVLQATAEMDGGPVWASGRFPMRAATKSSLYRNEVTETAVRAVLEAIERRSPQPAPPGIWRPLMKQADRVIDWASDSTETVLRKIRSADGNPGLLDEIHGRPVYLHDATPAEASGPPGTWLGWSGTSLCRATVDGAVWIGHLRWKDPEAVKLPATLALQSAEPAPSCHTAKLGILAPPSERSIGPLGGNGDGGYRDIRYHRHGAVGYLHFPFHNGAMSTEQCQRLLTAYTEAVAEGTSVLVLMGGPDFWSNGIHLNTIEDAASPADESWRNINAMNDLTRAIVTTTGTLVISAMQGNAGAGGVFLALAADEVWARDGVVLNPHYKGMGNLYGSEYWTYLLPRRAGADQAAQVTQARLPIGTAEAQRLGLIDAHFGADVPSFVAEVERRAATLAADPALSARLTEKAARRTADEAARPLDDYRREELVRMTLNFYGFDPSYHVARYNFVRKVPKSRTPLYLARHRSRVI